VVGFRSAFLLFDVTLLRDHASNDMRPYCLISVGDVSHAEGALRGHALTSVDGSMRLASLNRLTELLVDAVK